MGIAVSSWPAAHCTALCRGGAQESKKTHKAAKVLDANVAINRVGDLCEVERAGQADLTEDAKEGGSGGRGHLHAAGDAPGASLGDEEHLGCVDGGCGASDHVQSLLDALGGGRFFAESRVQEAFELGQHERVSANALNGFDEVVVERESRADSGLGEAGVENGVAVLDVDVPCVLAGLMLSEQTGRVAVLSAEGLVEM